MQESSLTLGDDLLIRAGFNYLTQDMFKCEAKVEQYYKLKLRNKKISIDQAYEDAIQMVEIQNKCNTIVDKELYEIDGFNFHTCVCNFQHPDLGYYLTLFSEYDKHGTLPFEGNLTDQPNYIIEVFCLIRNLKLEKDQEDREKQEKQNKKGR